MLNLNAEKELIFTSSSMNIHGVEKIQVIHEEDGYTEIAIVGAVGFTLRIFHESEADIPLNIINITPETPPPAPVEEFPAYPLT